MQIGTLYLICHTLRTSTNLKSHSQNWSCRTKMENTFLWMGGYSDTKSTGEAKLLMWMI